MGRRWIVAALGALVAAAPLAAQNARYRDSDDESRSRIDTTLALAGDGTVDLSLVSGEIHVTSWNRGEVKIHATSDRGILRLDASPSRLTLSVRSERGDLGDTRYEVTVPASARVITRSVSGDIESRGGSEVEAHSVSGDITLSDASGRARIETVSGTVHATHVGSGLRVDAVSGDLSLSDIVGDVDVQTVSGEIELDGVRSSYVHTETVSGDTRFAGTLDPKGRYELHSHSGDIRLSIPPVGASFEVETFSGDIESDYPMTMQPRTGGDHKRMEFAINGGGARVSAETFSGDVKIERASGAHREE